MGNKYKLLVDLAGTKAGAEFETDIRGMVFGPGDLVWTESLVRMLPTIFQPVELPTPRLTECPIETQGSLRRFHYSCSSFSVATAPALSKFAGFKFPDGCVRATPIVWMDADGAASVWVRPGEKNFTQLMRAVSVLFEE